MGARGKKEEFCTLSRPVKPLQVAGRGRQSVGSFTARIVYVSLNATDEPYAPWSTPGQDSAITRVYYLATPPAIFARICESLKENGLVTPNSRVVLEKPLGRDLASAKQINAEVGKVFEESQIYRIDHYLGKETVQNVLAPLRQQMFEPPWRRESISA